MQSTTANSNKTVVISGAAGGLGQVLVKKFAGLGFNVFALDNNLQGLTQLDSINNVITRALDVTEPEQIQLITKELEVDSTGIDILICLAGIYNTYPVTEASPDLFKKIMAVNLHGVASLVQAFLKPLIKRSGRVIVVSSESYRIQAMFQPYMISKAALEAYCRVARQELALKGVKLAVIRPGAIRTPLLNWMESPADPDGYPVFEKAFRKNQERSVKMVGKIVSPEEVAEKIFLAATVSKPKRIYRINNSPLLSFISLLPAGIFDRLIIKLFRK